MKFIVKTILLLFFGASVSAQQNVLEFNKKIYECENKWITYPKKEKDSVYELGYVYIDRDAGFSFHSEKKFRITKDHKFIPVPKSSISKVISRIQSFDAVCAVISDGKFKELGITGNPVFMKSIVVADEAEDLVLRASTYNHIGASFMAIPLLEKAQKINPETKGLLLEFARAYKIIGNYKKTIELFQSRIDVVEKDPLLLKELIYALAEDDQLENAEAYFLIMKKIKDAKYMDEAAYRITWRYYLKRDAIKFEEWAKETMSHLTSTDTQISGDIHIMREKLKQ